MNSIPILNHKTVNLLATSIMLCILTALPAVSEGQVQKEKRPGATDERPTGVVHSGFGFGPINHDMTGRTRVMVLELLDTDHIYYAAVPEMSFVKASMEQQRRLAAAFKSRDEVYKRQMLRYSEESRKLRENLTPENLEKINELMEKRAEVQREREQFYWEFGFTIADELSDRQLEALRGLAYMKALEHFGSFEKLLVQSHAENQMDWTKIYLEDPELRKRLTRVLAEHRRKLMELQKETMEQVLEALPEESRAVVEYAAGVDTLKRTAPK